MTFTSVDAEIIRAITNNKIVSMYELHERYLLSPGQILESIERLRPFDVLNREGHFLTATEKTRAWAILHRFELFSRQSRSWLNAFRSKRISDDMMDEDWRSSTLARNYFLNRVNVP